MMSITRRLLFQQAAAAAAVSTPRLGRHRNLFNGDSCVYFYNPEIFHPEGLPYTAKAVHRYVDLLADNGVDTFLINPNAQVAFYPSKKLPTILDGYRRGDRDFFRAHAVSAKVPPDKLELYLDDTTKFFNLYLDLVEAGVDWLAETSKACRRRRIAPWVSVRMNDMHGAGNPQSNFNCPLFKQSKYRLTGRTMTPAGEPYYYWAALNYELPEVRSYMMSHVREYVEEYDFEGMELDWLRNPQCCEPIAGAKQIQLMSSWIREIRKLTKSRHRDFVLGLRLPANLGYMKSIGVDVQALAREGIIDFVNFSNFWQTSWDIPYDRLRLDLGENVAIYGVTEDAPNWVEGYSPETKATGPRYLSAGVELLRGNAASKLSMGVDGIEQFNFFCTDQPRIPGMRAQYSGLRDLGDLSRLRGQSKHYCLSTARGHVSDLWETPAQLPVSLEPKTSRDFQLSMSREPAGRSCTIQLVFADTTAIPEIGVRLNGGWPVFQRTATRDLLFRNGPYTQHAPAHQAFNYRLDPAGIREGMNSFTLVITTAAARLVSLEISIT
ncbi:MAG TPA: hypothetical protein VMZ52_05595 [Bryobacteraceae bacterium]|nr:hypothetical protein [Bryobacteraceae bacterium]